MPPLSIEPPCCDTLKAILRRSGAVSDAAEAHGSFCGLVCSLVERPQSIRVFGLLAENGPGSPIEAEFAERLMRIAESTCACLTEGDLSFCLFQPSDDEGLERQTTSLAEWCQGFMHGLSETSAESEAAYLELVEYVRVNVQFVFEETLACRRDTSLLN